MSKCVLWRDLTVSSKMLPSRWYKWNPQMPLTTIVIKCYRQLHAVIIIQIALLRRNPAMLIAMSPPRKLYVSMYRSHNYAFHADTMADSGVGRHRQIFYRPYFAVCWWRRRSVQPTIAAMPFPSPSVSWNSFELHLLSAWLVILMKRLLASENGVSLCPLIMSTSLLKKFWIRHCTDIFKKFLFTVSL